MLPDLSKERLLASIEPKSDQLSYDDMLNGPVTFTVAGVSAGSSDQPVQIRLDGEKRYFRPCKSMRRVLIFAWGDSGHQWVGRSLTLVGDPSVKFGGVAVGGIRISHLSHIDGPLELALTVTRSKRAPYKVLPLKTASTGAQRGPSSDGPRPEDTPEGGNPSTTQADPPGAPDIDAAAIITSAEEMADQGYTKLQTYFESLSRDGKLALQPELPRLKERAEKSDIGPMGI